MTEIDPFASKDHDLARSAFDDIATDLRAISVWHDSENPSRMALGALASRALNFISEQSTEIERLKNQLHHMAQVFASQADEIAVLREGLQRIAHPEKGMRPADQKEWLRGYVPQERRIARETLERAAAVAGSA